MATKNDFKPEEWETVASGPIIAAAVISASDDTGEDRDSEDEEIDAFKNALKKLKKKYAKSMLIADVIDYIQSEGTEEFEVLFNAIGAAASHESPLEDRVKAIAEAGEIVDRVADKKESKLYKNFVVGAATAVAAASKEGFFVFTSNISKKEDFYLRQIQRALGV